MVISFQFWNNLGGEAELTIGQLFTGVYNLLYIYLYFSVSVLVYCFDGRSPLLSFLRSYCWKNDECNTDVVFLALSSVAGIH